ncbi:tetratricopeptide repeat protein [Legionella dresdenensis]|uniref:Tetratricopeptide repeat protein n=1 Tax=Legionella dresdenensis TaxID=450200 RepID=A0ABV8CG40_9GAMM
MKTIAPWFCLVAAAGSQAFAAEGIDAYRQGNFTLAAQSLASESQDPVVNYYLGMMRLYGYGELKNNQLALRYFTKSAEKGFLPAQKLLASYYLTKAVNPEQALYWYKKAAAKDDTTAQMYCAAAYLFGYGTRANSDAARAYYIEAAKNGNAIAQYALARNFLDSRDNRSKKLGVIWLGKSAAQSNPMALTKLAELYTTGTLVAKDPAKAQELLLAATNQDYVPAMIALGDIAQKENNLQQAKDWFSKAVEKKNLDAQVALANLYADKNSPFYNARNGFDLMLKAAEQGSTKAQLAVSAMYKDGLGVTADEKQAAHWQLMAQARQAKPTDVIASVNVARWLSNGKDDNFEDAYKLGGIYTAWTNPSALKENNYNQPPQMDVITRKVLYKPQFVMTQPGDIPVNEYFDILAPTLSGAESNDWSFPRYSLDDQIMTLLKNDSLVLRHDTNTSLLDKDKTQPQENTVKPFDYIKEKTAGWKQYSNYQTALSRLYGQAILGDSAAQFELGQLYQYGVIVAKNPQQAIAYYQLAALQQDVRAEYNLGIIYLEGQTNPVDYQRGIEWMTDAAFKGNPYAQYALANIFEKGLKDPAGAVVVNPDHQQAMAMYYLASSNHFGPAEYRLADYLVKEKWAGLSVAARQNRNNLIKRLYEGASKEGIAEAVLPLAFYNAMDTNPAKQAQAFAVAKKQAEQGNQEAALLTGMMYERGLGVAANKTEALRWYKQSGSNPVSNFILGTYYSEGISLPKDVAKGKQLLQQAANANFSYANLNLAVLQQQTGQDFLAELDKARQLGNSKAGLLLADYYLQQANNPDKMKQARDIYQFFADKGDKDGQLKLAFLYDRGLGGESNVAQAAYWYNLSAGQGQPIAQYLLGQMYQMGRIDKEPDYAQAKRWYAAAQASYTPASVALGYIYDTVDADYANAAKNYILAANSGDAIGQYDLGLIYENGKGQSVDREKAKLYYQKAAEQGYAKAMSQLANLLFYGINGKRDQELALAWYKKAASLNDNDALYQLGLLSETGVATQLDYPGAVNFYQRASEQGNEKAKMALARMYQYGLGVPQDMQHAADIYKQLAENHNAYAQYQLAMIYLDGSLGQRQPEQGKTLLQRASVNGSPQAQKLVQRLTALQEPRASFIESVVVNQAPVLANQPADLIYMDALNEWNRGDETMSRMILDKLRTQYPQFAPAKRAYEQLNQHMGKDLLGQNAQEKQDQKA